MSKKIDFVFFGGEPLSVPTLERLYTNGFIPRLIVCNPDKPRGRNLEIIPPPTKIWATQHAVPYLQPEKLDAAFTHELKKVNPELGIVVSYGKIIPKEIINLPTKGIINLHPSLLPSYRGPAPIVTPILNGDSETGVTIIKIDEEMDHGPILAQEKIDLNGNEFVYDLEKTLAGIGGDLLVKVLPDYATGNINPVDQDHSKATYVKKMVKAEGEINLNADGIKNWRKFRAYFGWPGVFFFKDGKRIKITDATLENNQFIAKKVIPEGKKEITWDEFNK